MTEYIQEFTNCYKCRVKIPNRPSAAPVCDRCWDDNMKVAASGWKDADKLTLREDAP